MPFFELTEDSGEWVAMHHPFTMPMEECIPYLDTDKAKVRAKAFDLVLNGTELSSGSMRITDCELQNKMFELLGMEKRRLRLNSVSLLKPTNTLPRPTAVWA
jgi:aspartyl-tRNA synthetase